MKKPILLVLLAGLMLTGCSAATPAVEPSAEPAPTATVAAKLTPADIVTIDDGIAWARSLDGTETAKEVSAGIQKIGDLVPKLDIWFADNNEIGRDLINLNMEVLSGPANAGASIDDLNTIVDHIEKAIAKGDKP